MATHLIKIKGTYDAGKWTPESLKDCVKKKIKEEIEPMYHTDLELFQAQNGSVEVWVYIRALPSEPSREVVGKWLGDHIKEDGLQAKSFAVEEVAKWWDRPAEKGISVLIP